jgi:hypothetical protein
MGLQVHARIGVPAMSSKVNPYSGLPEVKSEDSFARGYDSRPYRASTGPNFAGVVIGLVIGIGALLLTVAGHDAAAASSSGGTYIVFYGAIIGGFWMALKSLVRG